MLYLKTGKLKPARVPGPAKAKPKLIGPKELPKYKRYAKQVLELVERNGLSYEEIAKKLGISSPTAQAAYHFANHNNLAKAVAAGDSYMKPMPTKLRKAKENEIVDLAKKMKPKQIAEKLGVSENTIRRCLLRQVKPQTD